MIVEIFALIIALGTGLFIIGTLLGLPEIAFIGAVIVIGAGGIGLVDGVETKTGEVETTVNNTTTTENVYEPISSMESFPFEFIVLLVGAVMAFRSAGEMEQL